MAQEKVINRWLVVIGGCIIGLLSGLVYAWSIFVSPVCEAYGWGTDQVALMGNMMMAMFCLGASIGGNMLPKLGSRTTSLIGALMFGLGILVSAFVRNPILMYITWGVCGGLGVGILYNVGMFVTSAWFPDKRGVIMGIFLALFGLALTVFSKPISALLASAGVQTTMLSMGIVFTVVLGLIALFLMKTPPEGWHPDGYVAPAAGAKSADEMESLTVSEAMKTQTFWRYFLAFFFLVIPYSFISSYTTVFVTSKGLETAQAVTIVSLMGIGAALGRFLGGIILDKLHSKVTYAIFCLCSVVAGLLLLMSNSFVGLAAAFILVSAGYGGRTPMYGVFPVEQFGPKNASAIYGAAVISTVVSSLLGPAITAATRNATGSWTITIVVSIVAALIGMFCIITAPKHTPFMKKNGIPEEK